MDAKVASGDYSYCALAGQDAFDDLVVRCQLIARVMVDVLKWFDDDYAVD
jgi:hypothetical protein